MPTFPGDMSTAGAGKGDAQRKRAMDRVQVGDLGDRHVIVFKDLCALEFNPGQAQLRGCELEAQMFIKGLQLRALSGFIAR